MEVTLDRKFLRDVPLPPGLTLEDLYTALERTVGSTPIQLPDGTPLRPWVQANTYSGIVSNIFTGRLREAAVHVTQPGDDTHFPDLRTLDELPLEIKASNKPWKGGEGHNGHESWTIVASFVADDDGLIDIATVCVAYLLTDDWRYRGSEPEPGKGTRRTETYETTPIGTAKLRDGAAYWNPDRAPLKGFRHYRMKLREELPIPTYSPFFVPTNET